MVQFPQGRAFKEFARRDGKLERRDQRQEFFVFGGNMTPTVGVAIMMNNYFHDVATALLLASGTAVWIIYRSNGQSGDEAVRRYFLSLYRSMTRLALFALGWIILGGIPRTIFYTEFEWANAAGKNQIPALIVKHVLMFLFVSAGAYLWFAMGRKAKTIRENLEQPGKGAHGE